ncbi:PREDICTED: NF-kappa-B inhibitor delta [Nanorana parkeri]|uniref:NF-kappa-B inhibitor delta n=1 Tax=Nanorana parkeri TaxID=125878 RepID=UPI0008544312|nr:PREDICTED: NF-kappa-B inhibitor delta [Nanorana parkeri]
MSSPPPASRGSLRMKNSTIKAATETVKKLLEQKRQQHNTNQISAPLVEYSQESGAVSTSFVHHSPVQQEDEPHVFQRPTTHYAYPPPEDLYGPGAMYSHDGRWDEIGRTEAQALEPDLGAVSAAHAPYLPTFPHDPSWLALVPCSVAAADTYSRVPGSVVTELMAQDLEEARLKLQNLSPDHLLQQDGDGDTWLHLYAARGLRSLAYAAAERYLQYGKLDLKEHNGKTPLLVAVTANQPEIVYDLIRLGADVSAADCKGQTALHVAATYGLSDVLRVFLALPHQKNLDLEATNYDGLTPLHCAVIAQNNAYKNSQNTPSAQQHERETLSCVQLLLQMGANLTSQEIKSNKTVLHLAVQAGNIPLVTFFLQMPHIDLAMFINMKAHGNTALHMAAALPPNRSTEYLIQRLLFNGGDPSVRNLENDQPAHLVPPGELSEQIKLLLKKRRGTSSSRSHSAASS